MAGIFVSYRRQDSSGWAGNLSRGLAEEFGKDKVFFDIATLEPGVDYEEAIERRVGLADVLIVVIGPQWLTAVDDNGQRRLDDPEDLARTEVVAALNRNIPVVPVLVGGAAMPSASELPQELQSLARRNAYELSDRRWNYDLAELAKYLRNVISPKRFRFTRLNLVILAAFLLVPGIVAAYYSASTIMEAGKDLFKRPIEQSKEPSDKGEALKNFVCRSDPNCISPDTTRFGVIKACWPAAGVPEGTLMLDFLFQDAFAEERRSVADCLGL